jgi:hypothetical protein
MCIHCKTLMYHLQTYVPPGLLPTLQAYSLTLGLLLNPQVYIAVFTTQQYLPQLHTRLTYVHDLYKK